MGKTGDVDLQQKDINGKGHYFINSGVGNYGIKGKTDRPARIFPKNTITIDFWGYAFYRNFEYKLATHNHVFSLSGECIKNEKVGLFLCAALTHLKNICSYSNMGTLTRFKQESIFLPINSNGEIDFDLMENLISAIQKLAIKNVAIYAKKELEAYKQATR